MFAVICCVAKENKACKDELSVGDEILAMAPEIEQVKTLNPPSCN